MADPVPAADTMPADLLRTALPADIAAPAVLAAEWVVRIMAVCTAAVSSDVRRPRLLRADTDTTVPAAVCCR